MARPRKQMTVELVDARIEQLEGELETLNTRVRNKKNEIVRLKNQRKRLEQARLVKLLTESGKDYSELLEILGTNENEEE